MEVLTCTSHKEFYMVYTKIHYLTGVNSCQKELARKDIYYYEILLWYFSEWVYARASKIDIENSFYQQVLILLMILMQKFM